MKNYEGDTITAIFYAANRPHSVFTSRDPGRYGDEWDFNHCPLDGDILVYHNSGSGPNWPYLHPWPRHLRPKGPPMHKLWLAPGAMVAPCSWRTGKREKPTRCARALRRMGYRLLRHPILVDGNTNPFLVWTARYGPDRVSPEYCEICACFRSPDYGDPCEHLIWCEKHGNYTGIGSQDPCNCLWADKCPPGCGHSTKEHQAFERGLYDGERGADGNPYWDSATGGQGRPNLVLAWDTGHSVGRQNAESTGRSSGGTLS